MKKIAVLLICISIMMTVVCIFAEAANNTYTYAIGETEYTVEIINTDIPDEKKQVIADSLVGVTESEVMPANIWCDLFGHDYKYTTATVVQHKAKTYSPRCKTQLYDVTYCEDCDYTEQTLLQTSFLACCPEE